MYQVSRAAAVAAFFITFSSIACFGQNSRPRTCEDLFKKNPRLSVAEIVRAERELMANEKPNHELKTPEHKVAFALQRLSELGVRAERTKFRTWYYVSRPAVHILPEGDAQLNQIAEAMSRVYGISLYYDPKALNKDDGITQGEKILISQHSAFTGEPDLTLFHEIRHVAMTSKEANGQATVTNGFALRFVGQWPWRNAAADGYPRLVSVQERATSYQNFTYVVIAAKALLRQKEISEKRAEKYLVNLEATALRARKILMSVQAMAEFEQKVYEAGGGNAFYTPVNDEVRSFVYKLPLYLHVHVVPREIFLEYLPPDFESASVHEKTIFFKMSAGREVARNMALALLVRLQEETQIDLKETDRILNLIERFEVEPDFYDVRKFLREVVARKEAVASEEAAAVVRPERRPFTTEWELPITAVLPEKGYSFSELSSSFVHERTFRQRPMQELKQEIKSNAPDAYYGIVEIKLSRVVSNTHVQPTLTLEWNEATFAELERMLDRLTRREYSVVDARIKYASPVSPKWLPNAPALLVYEPVLQKLRDLPADLFTTRNRVRYLRMVNSQR